MILPSRLSWPLVCLPLSLFSSKLVAVVWFHVVLMRFWLSGYRLPISIKQASPSARVHRHGAKVQHQQQQQWSPRRKLPQYSSAKCWKPLVVSIARPHRKHQSLDTPVPRLRSLCDGRTKSLGSCFFFRTPVSRLRSVPRLRFLRYHANIVFLNKGGMM